MSSRAAARVSVLDLDNTVFFDRDTRARLRKQPGQVPSTRGWNRTEMPAHSQTSNSVVLYLSKRYQSASDWTAKRSAALGGQIVELGQDLVEPRRIELLTS